MIERRSTMRPIRLPSYRDVRKSVLPPITLFAAGRQHAGARTAAPLVLLVAWRLAIGCLGLTATLTCSASALRHMECQMQQAVVVVGTRVKDHDPRNGTRDGEVVALDKTYATVRWSTGRTTKVRLDRIGTKRHRGTWAV